MAFLRVNCLFIRDIEMRSILNLPSDSPKQYKGGKAINVRQKVLHVLFKATWYILK